VQKVIEKKLLNRRPRTEKLAGKVFQNAECRLFLVSFFTNDTYFCSQGGGERGGRGGDKQHHTRQGQQE
jgi:hypothetical protein